MGLPRTSEAMVRATDSCWEKSVRGNLYYSKQAAKFAASRMTRHVGEKIIWFRCGVCRRWHLAGGKRDD